MCALLIHSKELLMAGKVDKVFKSMKVIFIIEIEKKYFRLDF